VGTATEFGDHLHVAQAERRDAEGQPGVPHIPILGGPEPVRGPSHRFGRRLSRQ
jgi:hypothetical protein